MKRTKSTMLPPPFDAAELPRSPSFVVRANPVPPQLRLTEAPPKGSWAKRSPFRESIEAGEEEE